MNVSVVCSELRHKSESGLDFLTACSIYRPSAVMTTIRMNVSSKVPEESTRERSLHEPQTIHRSGNASHDTVTELCRSHSINCIDTQSHGMPLMSIIDGSDNVVGCLVVMNEESHKAGKCKSDHNIESLAVALERFNESEQWNDI
jgi:hypothetical protein